MQLFIIIDVFLQDCRTLVNVHLKHQNGAKSVSWEIQLHHAEKWLKPSFVGGGQKSYRFCSPVTANNVSALCGRVMLEGQVKKACHLDPEPTSQWVKMRIPPPAGECLVAVRKWHWLQRSMWSGLRNPVRIALVAGRLVKGEHGDCKVG